MKFLLFKNPKKADIVIYDQENSQAIRENILHGKEFEVLYARFEKFFIGPKILLQMLLSLDSFEFWVFKHKKLSEYPKTLLGRLYKIYLLAFLKVTSPKVVITHIDDCHGFSWLVKNYKKAEFFAIQNGVRDKNGIGNLLPKAPLPGSKITLTNFFCFGKHEEDIYKELGHEVKKFIPVGSLRFRLSCDKVNVNSEEKKNFDLCIISSWDHNTRLGIGKRHNFRAGFKILHRNLAYATKQLDLKICIALNQHNMAFEEKKYYRSIYGNGDNIFFQERNDENFSTYNTIKFSTLTVATISTCLREAFGFGKKVLFCNFTRDETYDLPVKGFWSWNTHDRDLFVNRIKLLLNMPQSDYIEKTKEVAKYFMEFPEIPTNVLIRNEIDKFLSKS